LTKRVALAAVTIAAALLLLTAFSLQSVLYSQIIQQSSYAQEPAASPMTDGNASSSSTTTTTDNNNDTTKTNGLLTATINDTYFTTNQTILVNGTVGEAAGPFIAVYVELKDPHNDTLAFDFAPIARSNEAGADNETSFSYRLIAGDLQKQPQGDGSDTKRFWKAMNETGDNYTMIVGYASPPPPSSSSGSAEENFRSEVQFVFAYEHLPPEEEGAAVATTTTTPEEPEPEEEESEDSVTEAFLAFIPYLALVTRVWVGANMMIHGYPKLKNMKQTAEETKQTLGIPVRATYTATILEFFGGLFLIIGLIVPVVALFFAIFMIANVIMKKRKMDAAYIAPDKASYEIDITYLILSIILIVLGAGALSVDSVIGLLW